MQNQRIMLKKLATAGFIPKTDIFLPTIPASATISMEHGTARNGKVDFGANGVLYGTYQNRTVWGYVVNGKLQQYETVAKNSNGWLYISPNGFVDFSADTVAKNSNGWWGIQNGKVNFNYTSLADNKNGTWYCRNRKLDYSATTVADEKNN